MTRRLLTLLSVVTALLLLTAALAAPVSVEGAALPPAQAATPRGSGGVDVHLGDGILRLRVRTCAGCAPILRLEITLPKVRIDWSPKR